MIQPKTSRGKILERGSFEWHASKASLAADGAEHAGAVAAAAGRLVLR